MKYLSVCSGIEAATVAWHDMGWTPVAFSEIEKFPSQVLNHHYPTVPNVGDMTKFEEWNLESVELLVGGTPCQSFSVAGLRKGLDDPRGNLMLTYGAIAKRFKPKWLVWENVPGVLSSNGGRDFGTFLGMLGELGYGFAYRVLDAQYFGVAQRRRRVFVVGYLGNWHRAAAVLFDRESVSGNPAPSREAGQRTARSTQASSGVGCIGGLHPNAATGTELAPTLPSAMGMGGGHIPAVTARMTAFGQYESDDTASSMKARDYKDATDLVMQPVGIPEVMSTLLSSTAGISRPGNAATEHALTNTTFKHNQVTAFSSNMSVPDCQIDVSPTLKLGGQGGGNPPAIAFNGDQSEKTRSMGESLDGGYSLNYMTGIQQSMAVRRLTPVECERLQGFPDNYTNIKENCPDGPRYKALGNSMAVPVMRWIGQRIQSVEGL